jgi:hypothetical protein
MININDVSQNIGNYIRFGGKGTLDGLKLKQTKYGFYKIISANKDRIEIKGYKRRYKSFLFAVDYDQEYEILNSKQFKLLPLY